MNKAVLLAFLVALSAVSVQAQSYYTTVTHDPIIYSYPKNPVNYFEPIPYQQGFKYFQQPALNYYYYYPNVFLPYYRTKTYSYPQYIPSTPKTYNYPHYQEPQYQELYNPTYNEPYNPSHYPKTYGNARPSYRTYESSYVLREFTITATDSSFSPRDIEAREGENIKVVFHNYGNRVHTYTVDEIGIDSGLVYPGNSKTIEFTIPRRKNVTLTSYSRVSGDKQAGLFGRIIIR